MTSQKFFMVNLQVSLGVARKYVKAEKFVNDNMWSFHWSIDPNSDSSDWTDEKPAWRVWQCCVRDDNGKLRGSLHGIDFGRDGAPWGDPYRRVVEAELAMDGQNNSPQ